MLICRIPNRHSSGGVQCGCVWRRGGQLHPECQAKASEGGQAFDRLVSHTDPHGVQASVRYSPSMYLRLMEGHYLLPPESLGRMQGVGDDHGAHHSRRSSLRRISEQGSFLLASVQPAITVCTG